MSSATSWFCAYCGAANPAQSPLCFACNQPASTGVAATDASVQPHVLKQRYEIVERLGQGGMGAVYKARDTDLGARLVAVKEMVPRGQDRHEEQEAVDSFKREALLLAALTHPHLPRIYDHFSEDGRWYLVMDFIEGETFETYLERQPAHKIPYEEALEVALQLCSVLDYLHTRQPPIIFRDLKPSNIMRGNDGQLYLIDFGIARHFKPGQARDTIAFGSPGYAAPEQYGKLQTTPRADIYSLGALLHQMLTGEDPSETPFFFAPLASGSAPGGLHYLLKQMLEMDIQKRPASIAQVRQQLQQLSKQTPGQDLPLTHPQTLPIVHQPGTAGPQVQVQNLTVYALDSHAARSPVASSNNGSVGSLISRYMLHTNWISSLAWSPDGTRIASASYDGSVQIWDAFTGALQRLYKEHARYWLFSSGRIYGATWSPDGKRIASAGEDKIVRLWNIDTGNQHAAYKVHTGRIRALSWSPDGQSIASSNDETVRVWKPVDGKDSAVFAGGVGTILALAWSPNSRLLALAGDGAIARIYELMAQDTRKVVTLNGHVKPIQALSWSPDARYIATASDDGTVRVWEAQTGQAIIEYYGHTGPVKAVAWSPAGKRIASAGDDNTVQLWHGFSDHLEYVYRGHFAGVFQVAWSPDGQTLASSDAHNVVQVWRALP